MLIRAILRRCKTRQCTRRLSIRRLARRYTLMKTVSQSTTFRDPRTPSCCSARTPRRATQSDQDLNGPESRWRTLSPEEQEVYQRKFTTAKAEYEEIHHPHQRLKSMVMHPPYAIRFRLKRATRHGSLSLLRFSATIGSSNHWSRFRAAIVRDKYGAFQSILSDTVTLEDGIGRLSTQPIHHV